MFKTLIAVITLAAISALYAQAPSPSPTPAQVEPVIVASRMIAQVDATVIGAASAFDKGIAATKFSRGYTAEELKTAAGPDAVARIQAAAKALKGK